jgi:hypothetical protein
MHDAASNTANGAKESLYLLETQTWGVRVVYYESKSIPSRLRAFILPCRTRFWEDNPYHPKSIHTDGIGPCCS